MLAQVKTAARVARCGMTSGRPMSLVYLTTMKCNARCKMCLYWKEVWGSESQNRGTMTLEQIDTFTKSMGRLLQTQISGGEPFIRKDMGEIMLVIGRNCNPVIMTIPTNGSYPDRIVPAAKALCTQNPGTMLRMNISVDGYRDKQDEIRKIPGLYAKCKDTIMRLKEVQKECPNLTVNITTVLSYYNVDGIDNTIEKLREDLCPDHFNMMLARGDTPEAQALDVPVEEYERVAEKIRNGMEQSGKGGHPLKGLGKVLEKEVSSIVSRIAKEKRQVVPCIGGTKHIMIDDDGSILPCDILKPFLLHNPTPELDSPFMAKLSDFNYSVPDALASVQARKVAQFVKDGKCWCTSECLVTPGVMLTPSIYPKLGMSMVRQFIEDLVRPSQEPVHAASTVE